MTDDLKKTSADKQIQTISDDNQLAPFNAEALISQAIQQKVPVETMERLLTIRRELKAEFAKEQFDQAMANFQAECPTIQKTKEVKTKAGIVAYRYAPIESIIEQVKKFLQKNGFSYSTQMITGEGKVKATCIVKHKFGHQESCDMEVPLGNKTEIMSNTQVVAAASTFAKRYAFCNAFGILTGDEDTDAANSPMTATQPIPIQPRPVTPKPIPPNRKNGQQEDIKIVCEECNALINQAVSHYSTKVFGKNLCYACQKTAKKLPR